MRGSSSHGNSGYDGAPARNGRAAREGLVHEYGDANFQNHHPHTADSAGSFARGAGGGAAVAAAVDFSKVGMLPAGLNNGNNVASLPSVNKSKIEASVLGGGIKPGKLLGGEGNVALRAADDDYDYYCGDDKELRDDPGGGGSAGGDAGGKKKLTAEEKAERKAKKAKKLEKEAQKLAMAQQHGADDGGQVYTDEAGAGESAGITHEWGWANDDQAKLAYEDGDDSEPAYSDDEDFATENKKNRKGSGNGNGNGTGNGNGGGGATAHPPAKLSSKSSKAPKRKGGGGGGGLPAL